METHTPPKGFISSVHAMLESIAYQNIPRLRAVLDEMVVLRDKTFDSPDEVWWNAGLTIGQMANEFMTAGYAAAKVHLALDKSPRDARILRAISEEPVNQGRLAARLSEYEGNLSKALDDLEERGLVMRRKESRSKILFLSSAGASILETHRNLCQLGPTCALLAPTTAVQTVAAAAPIPGAPVPRVVASEASSAIARRIGEVESKLREDHDRIEVATQRLRELREIIERRAARPPLPAAREAVQDVAATRLEAAIFELKTRLAQGKELTEKDVVQVVGEGLQVVEREFK